MRSTLLLAIPLLALSFVTPPAAAASTCGGNWAGSNVCFFACDSPTILLRGHADAPGIASVSVRAECGIVNLSGAFVPFFSYSCSASAPTSVDCSNMGPHTLYPAQLVGRCTVGGTVKGVYSCSSV